MTAAFAPAPQLVFDPRPALTVVPDLGHSAQPEHADGVDWAPEVAPRPMAVVYRRRRVVALAVVALVAGVALGLGSFIGSADATPTPESRAAAATLVIVQPGDTLWDIARSLDPASDPGELAARLADLTGSASLQVGQEILIPASLLD